jgi:hypothetical protein
LKMWLCEIAGWNCGLPWWLEWWGGEAEKVWWVWLRVVASSAEASCLKSKKWYRQEVTGCSLSGTD